MAVNRGHNQVTHMDGELGDFGGQDAWRALGRTVSTEVPLDDPDFRAFYRGFETAYLEADTVYNAGGDKAAAMLRVQEKLFKDAAEFNGGVVDPRAVLGAFMGIAHLHEVRDQGGLPR